MEVLSVRVSRARHRTLLYFYLFTLHILDGRSLSCDCGNVSDGSVKPDLMSNVICVNVSVVTQSLWRLGGGAKAAATDSNRCCALTEHQ